MKSSSRLTPVLRGAAVLLFLAGLALWAGTGARWGWTQTSAVQLQRDEITGIDYPVRRSAFLPGVEIPLLTTATAAGLAGLSLLLGRNGRRTSA